MLVIGGSNESKQDLSKNVGMISREQVALVELSMIVRTSSKEAGAKSERVG